MTHAHQDARDRLTFPRFLGIYAANLIVGIGGAFATWRLSAFDPIRFVFIYCGIGFLVAASGRPWWWSATIRSTGWFHQVPHRPLTWVLGALGAAGVALGGLGVVHL